MFSGVDDIIDFHKSVLTNSYATLHEQHDKLQKSLIAQEEFDVMRRNLEELKIQVLTYVLLLQS